MSTAYIVAGAVAALANLSAATFDVLRPSWLLANMTPTRRTALTTAGPRRSEGRRGGRAPAGDRDTPIGIAAAIGLVLFFLGAIVTAIRARWFGHIPQPATYLALATASLVLGLDSL